MKKRILMLLCTAVLALSITAPPALAAGGPFYPISVEEYTYGSFDELRINKVYGREECTVAPTPGADLAEQLREAVSHIQGTYQAAEVEADIADEAAERGAIPAGPDVKNFSNALVDGEVYFRENSVMKPVELSDTEKGRVAGMIGLRQIVNDLIQYQLEDYPEADIQVKQAELNAAYDAFYAKFGTINSSANARVFDEDSSYYLLCSLENIDEDGRLESNSRPSNGFFICR